MSASQIVISLAPHGDVVDASKSTGLTGDALTFITETLTAVGTVVALEAKPAAPVPGPPKTSVPYVGDAARAYNRRRTALDHAVNMVRDAIREGRGIGRGVENDSIDAAVADITTEIAKKLETYLAGGEK